MIPKLFTLLLVLCSLHSLSAMKILDKSNSQHEELFRAIADDDANRVSDLLVSTSVNIKGVSGWTPIACAIAFGRREIVQLLLTMPGIDVTVKTDAGSTLMHLEANYGQTTDILNDMLNSSHVTIIRGQINATNAAGQTPLIVASSCGHFEIVKLLLSLPNIDVNIVDKFGYTALTRAIKAEQNAFETVTELLKAHNLDLNITNKSQQTALMSAKELGLIRIVDLLNSHQKRSAHQTNVIPFS